MSCTGTRPTARCSVSTSCTVSQRGVARHDERGERPPAAVPLPHPFTPFVTRPVATWSAGSTSGRHGHHQSEWTAESVVVDYGIDPLKVRVHAFGIFPGRPSPGHHSRAVLVFVGMTLARKGGHEVLDVWRRSLRDRADLVWSRGPVRAEPGLRVSSILRSATPGSTNCSSRRRCLPFRARWTRRRTWSSRLWPEDCQSWCAVPAVCRSRWSTGNGLRRAARRS